MNRIIDKYSKYKFSLFLVVIFFLRFPPINLFLINQPLFNSHSIARYLILILLLICVIESIYKKKEIISKKTFFIFIVIYFISQSLSVLDATNIEQFILAYKNIVFVLLTVIIADFILDSRNKILIILYILVSTVFIDLLYQLIIYFSIDPFFQILEKIIYNKYWEVLNINQMRGRFFIDIYDCALIPINLVFYAKATTIKKIGLLLLIICTSLFTFISNFRAPLVIVVFALISSGIFLFNKAKFLIFFFLAFVFLILSYFVLVQFSGYNTLDRIVDPAIQDYSTIDSRFKLWNAAVEMGLSSPIYGVGLGNFQNNLRGLNTVILTVSNYAQKLNNITNTDPHNIFFEIFAETGFLGLISLILLLGYFIYNDIHILLNRTYILQNIVLAFWSLFIFSLLNPPTTFQYLFLFWLLRVMISKEKLFTKKELI